MPTKLFFFFGKRINCILFGQFVRFFETFFFATRVKIELKKICALINVPNTYNVCIVLRQIWRKKNRPRRHRSGRVDFTHVQVILKTRKSSAALCVVGGPLHFWVGHCIVCYIKKNQKLRSIIVCRLKIRFWVVIGVIYYIRLRGSWLVSISYAYTAASKYVIIIIYYGIHGEKSLL